MERPEWREKREMGDLPPSDERPPSTILARQWLVQTWNGLGALGHRGSTFLPSPSEEPSRTAAAVAREQKFIFFSVRNWSISYY